MDTSINTQLTDIIQLKNQLFKLAEKGKLSKQNFNSMSRSLDVLSFSLVEEINEKKLPDLISQFQQNNPELSFSPLEPIFRSHRFESLAKLRQDANVSVLCRLCRFAHGCLL